MNNYSPIFAVSSSGDMKKPFSKPLGDPSTTGEPSGFFVMSEKQCRSCLGYFPIDGFCITAHRKRGNYCKGCATIRTRDYFRTAIGLVSRICSNQKKGSVERGFAAPNYSVDELREWMFSQEIYHKLHEEWVESGYEKLKTPSCDRLDDYKPYTLDNLRIVTWEVNAKRYQSDRVIGKNNKQNTAVVCFDSNGEFVAEYHSQRHAHRVTGVINVNISFCCKRKDYTAGGFFWRFKRDCVDFDIKGLPVITGTNGKLLTGVPLKEQEVEIAQEVMY